MMKKNRIRNFVTAETTPINLVSEVSELRNKPEMVEQLSLSLSPRKGKGKGKRVTFNSKITTYEYVPIHESIESLPDFAASEEDDDFVTSSVEAEEYGDNDLDDFGDLDDYSDDDEDANTRFLRDLVWTESVLTASMESRPGSSSPPAIMQQAESPIMKRTKARDRGNYLTSVRNPVENITQWKAAKSKRASPLKPQNNNSANFKAPRLLFGPTPSRLKTKSNQETAVDTSLSNWSNKSKSSSGQSTTSEGCDSATSFKEFGWRTNARYRSEYVDSVRNPVENITQWKAAKSKGTSLSLLKPQKNNSVSPFMAFVSENKYDMAQDKKVNCNSTPFETRLDRALNRGAAA